MTKKNAAKTLDKSPRNEPNLDSRYGQIGISAVVAALQYKSEAKNPAYAPSTPRADSWREEVAA
jgi:hypothetical protein